MEEKSKCESKRPMTDEERLKLAQKLDSDLDEFINSLPKKKYEDGWPEDNWEEEMDKHPFFMKQAPKPGEELHPLYEGLQKLKYDPEENEPHELAISYKEDGNFNFKHKNYRLAIVAYTEGIKQKCNDPEIDSNLLNNRAAAHWFLKNYRSCLRDCELALKIKPQYEKVLRRAADCCFQMSQYDKAIEYCDRILELSKTDKAALELRNKCGQLLKVKERNFRKREAEERKRTSEEKALIKEIGLRGYNIEGGIDLNRLEPCFPQLAKHRVHLNEDSNSLIWPVVLVYPEYKIVDYIQEFSEQNSILDQLKMVFEEPPEWDREAKYHADKLNVYFENRKNKFVKVNVSKTLKDVLKEPDYIIKGGTPSFMVLVDNSEAEKHFLENH